MKLAYVVITVKNLSDSEKFYKELLGLTEVRRINPREGMEIVFLKDKGDNIIELMQHSLQNQENQEISSSRVAITFDVEDLDTTIRELKQKNIEIIDGPMKNYVFIYDPNGIRVGLKQDI